MVLEPPAGGAGGGLSFPADLAPVRGEGGRKREAGGRVGGAYFSFMVGFSDCSKLEDKRP